MQNEFIAINMLTDALNINLKSIYKVRANNGEIYKSKAQGDIYYCYVFVIKGKLQIQTIQSYDLIVEERHATFLWSNEIQSHTAFSDDVQFFWIYFSWEGKELPLLKVFKIEHADNAVKDFHYCIELLKRSNSFDLLRANMIFAKYVIGGAESLANEIEGGWHQRCIYKSIDYIRENLYALPTIQELATLVGMSLKQYRKHFKKVMGVYPAQYISKQKMTVAKDYLTKTDLTINQIADMMGFSSPYYLSSCFKKTFGCAPNEYRKQLRNVSRGSQETILAEDQNEINQTTK